MESISHGLGRRFQDDPRNLNFLMRDALAPVIKKRVKPTTSKLWTMQFPPLDQGNTGTCVGHGGKHFMLTRPILQTRPTTEPTAITLYKEACLLDEWPENDNGDLQAGTSVLALMKALDARHLLKGSYVWAKDALDVALWTVHHGPCILGIDWYEDMFTPNGANTIHPTGGIAGGHCLITEGYDAPSDAFILLNSWGPDWAHNGRVLLSSRDLDFLLANNGEAAAATEQKLK